jgi:hypothetical protein
VRRGLAWGAGIAGVLAAFFLRRKQAPVAHADPAAELRRKLATAREQDAAPAPDSASADEPAAPLDADARRREVHDQARQAIDEMRSSETPE